MSRIVAAMVFLIASCLSAYAALAWAILHPVDSRWLIASCVHLGVMIGLVALIYRWSHNASRYAMLFPLSGGILLAMLAFALRLCRTGKVLWRNTTYDLGAVTPSK